MVTTERQWPLDKWPLILLIALALGGCGSANTRTVVSSQTTTITSTQVVTERAATVTRTIAVIHRAPTPSASAPAAPAYTGSGSESVGTITVAQDSTLNWSCSGCTIFSIVNLGQDPGLLEVSSRAQHGTSQIAAGTYHQVHVSGDGSWSISITPG